MNKRMFCFLLLFTPSLYASSISLHTEALYWTTREGSADNWAQVIPTPLSEKNQIQILDMPFRWSPGFRAGLAYTPQSFWTLNLYYTYYNTQGNKSSPSGASGVYSSFLGNFYVDNPDGNGLSGPYYKMGTIHWDLVDHNLDLELSHNYSIDEQFNLKPIIGIKTGIIRQQIKTSWQTPFNPSTHKPNGSFSSAEENITNNFWGIGPSMGLEASWLVHRSKQYSLNLFGRGVGALMYGHWQLADDYYNNHPAHVAILNDRVNTAATMTQVQVGVELNYKTVSTRLTYEGQIWFNQMRYYSFNMGRLNNPLSFQGLTLGMNVPL